MTIKEYTNSLPHKDLKELAKELLDWKNSGVRSSNSKLYLFSLEICKVLNLEITSGAGSSFDHLSLAITAIQDEVLTRFCK